MNLSDKQINSYIEAHRKDFGETLSFDDARVEATRLIDFFVEMADGLARQRAAKEAPSQPTADPYEDHGNLKAVWQKTMRKRHI